MAFSMLVKVSFMIFLSDLINFSLYDCGCLGFLTNELLYSDSCIRTGYYAVAIGFFIGKDQINFITKMNFKNETNSKFNDLSASILSFIWSMMLIFGYWIPFIPLIASILGWIFVIVKIVLQYKIRVSWLEKQREKGADYSNVAVRCRKITL